MPTQVKITVDTPISSGKIDPVYNPIVYVIDSDYNDRPDFRYICDLEVEGTDIGQLSHVADFDTSKGIFDVHRMVENYLSYNLNWDCTGTVSASETIKFYIASLGYGMSRRLPFTSITAGSTSGQTKFTTAQEHTLRNGDRVFIDKTNKLNNPTYDGFQPSVVSASSTTFEVNLAHGTVITDTGYVTEAEKFGGFLKTQINGVDYTSLMIPNYLQTRILLGDQVYVDINGLEDGGSGNTANYNGQWTVLAVDLNTTFDFGGGIIAANSVTINAEWLDANASNTFGTVYSFNNYTFSDQLVFTAYTFNGVVQYDEYPTWTGRTYQRINANSKLLTNSPSNQNIRRDEYATLGSWNLSLLASNFDRVNVTLYDTNFSLLAHYDINNQYYQNLSIEGVDVGIGPANLLQLTQNDLYSSGSTSSPISGMTAAIASCDKYFVEFRITDGLGGTTTVSETKQYTIDTTCYKYTPIRIHFLNRLGRFDAFTFLLRSDKTIDIVRKNFKKALGRFIDTNTYSWAIGDRGTVTLGLEANTTVGVFSNWLTQVEADWLEELFTSPEVYWQDGGNLIPITPIVDSLTIGNKTNDKLLQYSFTFVLSNGIFTQRG